MGRSEKGRRKKKNLKTGKLLKISSFSIFFSGKLYTEYFNDLGDAAFAKDVLGKWNLEMKAKICAV